MANAFPIMGLEMRPLHDLRLATVARLVPGPAPHGGPRWCTPLSPAKPTHRAIDETPAMANLPHNAQNAYWFTACFHSFEIQRGACLGHSVVDLDARFLHTFAPEPLLKVVADAAAAPIQVFSRSHGSALHV